MAAVTFGSAGPQDPMFGIDHSRIVERLDEKNWRENAVCRSDGTLTYYIWVTKVELIRGDDRQPGYSVNVRTFPQKPYGFECGGFFTTLPEALMHANGEDGSEFALGTRPATQEEYPTECSAPIIIGGIPFQM